MDLKRNPESDDYAHGELWNWKSICVAACLFALNSSVTQAYTISIYPSSIYDQDTAVMDTALGVMDHQIEDFEDLALLPGFSYTLDGSLAPVTYTTVPNAFNGTVAFNVPVENWDGQLQLSNAVDNVCPAWPNFCGSPLGDRLTFNFGAGADSIGVGLVSFQPEISSHLLYINGAQVPGTLEALAIGNWSPGPFNRNTYVVVGLEPGDDPITSVGFGVSATAAGDVLLFDHVAVRAAPVPVPPGLWYMLPLCSYLWRRRFRTNRK